MRGKRPAEGRRGTDSEPRWAGSEIWIAVGVPAPHMCPLLSRSRFFLFKYLFIYLPVLGLRCGVWHLSCPGMELGPPALAAWSLSPWTTREAPRLSFAGCLCAALSPWPLGDCPLPYKTDWYSYSQPTPCGEGFISLVKLKLPSELGISVW